MVAGDPGGRAEGEVKEEATVGVALPAGDVVAGEQASAGDFKEEGRRELLPNLFESGPFDGLALDGLEKAWL